MANAKTDAKVKNDSTALSLNVNCLSPDGALCKNIVVKVDGHHDLVRGLADMDLMARGIHDQYPKTVVEGGKLHAEGLHCKTSDGTVKELSASAIVPPKMLNASHKASKFNGHEMGMSRW